MASSAKISLQVERSFGGTGRSKEPGGDTLKVNVTNNADVDIVHGRVSFRFSGGAEAGDVALGFVNARGGFDSKELSLALSPLSVHAEFELLDGSKVTSGASSEQLLGRDVNIVLTS